MWDQMVVATGPGLMEVMRIPLPRHSAARVSVRASAAYFEAEYGPPRAAAAWEAVESMLIMYPDCRSFMAFNTLRVI